MDQRQEVNITKALNDKREYKRLLLRNSLKVLLISDPDTDKAAAAMDVSIGAFSDPKGLEGLAHFLEHMLFYASEKYPKEDSYMQYLTEHGGRSNAFTDSEHTNFHFDVNAGYLEEALDRFAQFFICPLLSEDATSREINAVDSENNKNILVDVWRWSQLQKHLSSRDHPFHKFSTGNKDTLDVQPKARGVDVREELIKFYEGHYSSNLMHLVVYGKESIENLQNLVEEKFSAIKNTQRSRPYFPGQPCHSEHLQILVKTVPIKERHTLSILWPITPEIKNYKEGPSRYLGHLIGHEADGSLFCLLKSLGWASSLSAGETESSLEYAFFGVMIELTDAGQEHMEEIVKFIFQYLNILQKSGVAEWIFNEVQAICETKFHFQDKISPINYVMNIASNMKLYPPEDWLVASSLPSKFNPVIIQMVLDQLVPSNSRIFWASKQFEGQTNETEPWYRTAFSVENIKVELVKEWEDSQPDAKLGLPSPNVFIPTDLSLKQVEDKVKHPVLLRKSKFSRLWYKSDTMFFTPKAYIKLDFNCPESSSSPEAEILTNIFTKLLVDYLNEYAYYAEVAGLNYSIHHTGTGFQVAITGYNHKMRILLEKIFEKILNFDVKQDRFAVVKEKVLKNHLNLKFQQPYEQAFYYCSLLLEHCMWQRDEFLEVIPRIQADDLVKFAPRITSRMFFECYVAGNMTSKEAESVVQQIEDSLFNSSVPLSKPIFQSQHLERRIVRLDSGTNYYYPVEGLNEQDENSALHHYIQLEQDDTKMNVQLELFVLIAKQPAFYQLRSIEQLGYIVVLMKRNDSGIRGAQFIIQSTVKDPAQLDIRVEAFLKTFESKLHTLTDDEFKSNVNALIDMKLEKHKNLREETQFYWSEIDDGTLKFDRKEVEVAVLRKLTKEDLLNFFNNHIKLGAPGRRKMSFQVYGSSHVAEYKSAKSGEISSYESVVCNGKECALDGVDTEQLKDEKVEVVSSDKPVETTTELVGYHPKRIDDIYNFKRSQALFGSLKSGANQAYA
uniref:Insulin-degrading enzyme-like 1, peroxisomal n=1 Tax=Araucaria cunninghamii TaxID=56994 RepID=A0A0D6QRY2_ARACU